MLEIYIAIGVITILYLIGKRKKPTEIEMPPLKRDNCTQTMVDPMEIDTPSHGSLSDMEVESESEETSSSNYLMKNHFC